MRRLQLATKAPEVWKRVSDLVMGATHHRSADEFELRSVMRDAEKLANADPFRSSIVRATVHHLAGDLDGTLHWLANARRFPDRPGRADSHGAALLSNLGYFSLATECYAATHIESWDSQTDVVGLGVVSGAWEHLLRFCDGMPIHDDCADQCDSVRSAMMALEQASTTPADVRMVLDVAGEVMRRHALFFSGTAPIIHSFSGADGASVLYELAVPVGSEEAVQMTDEVLDTLVERDVVPPGFVFSFVPAA